MGLTIGIDSRQMDFPGESITIGRSPTAQLSLADARLAEQHAVLRLVAGRWLIEAQGDSVIRVGDGRPAKVAWLNPGDVIHLTETGPCLTFAPVPSAPQAAAVRPPLMTPAAVTPPAIPAQPAAVAAPPAPAIAAPVATPAAIPGQAPAFPPALRMAGVALVAVLGAVALIHQFSTPTSNAIPFGAGTGHPAPSAAKTIPSLVVEPTSVPGDKGKEEHLPSRQKPKDAALTADQLAAAVHLVLVSAPDRDQTYRLGAACAIGKRRLVTSGAVGQGIQQLREQLPMTTVQGVGKSPAAVITDVLVHPDYARLARIAAEAQAELDELREELEDSSDENAAEIARPKMIAVQDRLLDALQQQLDVDLAVLEVNRELPHSLSVATDDLTAVRPGTAVRLVGFPFPVEDFLVDPAAVLTTNMVAGQVQAKVPAAGDSIRRWLVKFRDAKPEDNWSGSPVVNSQGQVIGIYSRPTPPVELRDDYVPATHEVTVIERLVEIQREKQ